jgi:uncharacterized protein (TIGR02266 family)
VDNEHDSTSKVVVDCADTGGVVVERRERTEEQGPRLEVSLAVGIDSDSNFYVGFTENLSNGGIFVATHAFAAIGSSVGLVIELPNQTPIRAKGTVAWIREYSEANETTPGMGIRFEEVSQQDVDRILEFAKTRQPIFFDADVVTAERVLAL